MSIELSSNNDLAMGNILSAGKRAARSRMQWVAYLAGRVVDHLSGRSIVLVALSKSQVVQMIPKTLGGHICNLQARAGDRALDADRGQVRLQSLHNTSLLNLGARLGLRTPFFGVT